MAKEIWQNVRVIVLLHTFARTFYVIRMPETTTVRTSHQETQDEFHLSFERPWPKIQKFISMKIITQPPALATCQKIVDSF